MISPSDKAKLDEIVAAETSWIRETLSPWPGIEDKVGAIRHAITTVPTRGAGLRLLLLLGDDEKKAVFSELVDLASSGHSDIGLCRTVIKSLPRDWVLQHVQCYVNEVLLRSENEEAYRRLAELYCELDECLLESLVSRARSSPDAGIREVANDFSSPVEQGQRQSNKTKLTLFRIEELDIRDGKLVLLPGVPRGLFTHPEVRELRQGSIVQLRLPDGTGGEVTIADYLVRTSTIPTKAQLESAPIALVLPESVTREAVPVGTEVWISVDER